LQTKRPPPKPTKKSGKGQAQREGGEGGQPHLVPVSRVCKKSTGGRTPQLQGQRRKKKKESGGGHPKKNTPNNVLGAREKTPKEKVFR